MHEALRGDIHSVRKQLARSLCDGGDVLQGNAVSDTHTNTWAWEVLSALYHAEEPTGWEECLLAASREMRRQAFYAVDRRCHPIDAD